MHGAALGAAPFAKRSHHRVGQRMKIGEAFGNHERHFPTHGAIDQALKENLAQPLMRVPVPVAIRPRMSSHSTA